MGPAGFPGGFWAGMSYLAVLPIIPDTEKKSSADAPLCTLHREYLCPPGKLLFQFAFCHFYSAAPALDFFSMRYFIIIDNSGRVTSLNKYVCSRLI